MLDLYDLLIAFLLLVVGFLMLFVLKGLTLLVFIAIVAFVIGLLLFGGVTGGFGVFGL